MTDLAPLPAEGDPPARPGTHPTADQGDTEMPATVRKAIRLTPPMVELLTDIAIHPQMFITRFSQWSRTAQALIARGLAAVPPGYHGDQYELRITDQGRAEATRRGIGTDVSRD